MTNFNADIGRKLRENRIMLGLTQQQIGNILGVSFQQIQKYEKGENRLSAHSLKALQEQLGVNLLGEGSQDASPTDLVKEEMELLRTFRAIKNPKLQQHVINLIQALTPRSD